ncbi:DUF4147 domain-containing protein [Defluviimonas sp. SAOS-178_SWC]|uniref:DUF4147 domain-containing protein n=1 Tax=Defluviimonas sp. SAOS-178_SWC TaxID=3121287 RepID=UPI0032219287
MGTELDILRAEARRLMAAGLAAAAPWAAVSRALAAAPVSAPGPGGSYVILAIGRFAPAMAGAALSRLGPCETLVVTDAAAGEAPEGARVMIAGWPDSDAAGERAAAVVESALGGLGPEDRAVVLLSAGAAALVPAPAVGLRLADLLAAERMMRAAGAGAAEVALVRQQLSRFEGGGLVGLAAPAEVTVFVLADPAEGEDPRRIGGGMMSGPLGSRVTARALVELYGIWDRLPERLRRHLSQPAPGAAIAKTRMRIVGANALSVAAMAAAGARAFSRPLSGEPLELVHDIHAVAAGLAPGSAVAFGMEPMRDWPDPAGAADPADEGDAGGDVLMLRAPLVAGAAGPRHADLALRFACLARDRRLPAPWALLLSASDGGGADGKLPGVIVDSETLACMRLEGVDPDRVLERGGAGAVLEAAGAAFRTGPTGTDIGDLAVFVRG